MMLYTLVLLLILHQSHCRGQLYNNKKANLSLLSDTLSHVPWNNIIIETIDDELAICLLQLL